MVVTGGGFGDDGKFESGLDRSVGFIANVKDLVPRSADSDDNSGDSEEEPADEKDPKRAKTEGARRSKIGMHPIG